MCIRDSPEVVDDHQAGSRQVAGVQLQGIRRALDVESLCGKEGDKRVPVIAGKEQYLAASRYFHKLFRPVVARHGIAGRGDECFISCASGSGKAVCQPYDGFSVNQNRLSRQGCSAVSAYLPGDHGPRCV